MKIVVTSSMMIVSFGAFAFAKAWKDESIVNTDDMTVKQIVALATTNKAKITAKSKADILAQLNDHLVEHNTEVIEMSDAQKFEEIIVAGFEAEISDNDMYKQLFQAGCDYEDLKSTFKSIVESKGLRLSVKDRNTKTTEFLTGYVPDVEDVESHLAKISALQDHLGVSTSQTGASMRKWAKDNDITLPKVPTKSASTVAPGYRGNQKVVADHAIANPGVTFDQLVAFAAENVEKTKSGKDNSRGYAINVWNAIIFAKSFYGNTDTTDAEDAPVDAEADVEEAA